MERISGFLAEQRNKVLLVMMAITLLSLLFIPRVNVNTDMSKYLPDSSRMKQGVDILNEEFSGLSDVKTLRVMFRDMPAEARDEILSILKSVPHVESVSHTPGDARYEKDGYSLFVLGFSCGYFSREMSEAESYVRKNLSGRYGMVYCLDKTSQPGIPTWILVLAVSLLVVILVIMCASFIEPFLFMSALGAAVLINAGTNALLPDVSEITYSISAVLQLALSIDYSVILMGHYRQELKLIGSGGSKDEKVIALGKAIRRSFPSIAGSSLTTVVGLLTLVFMSFKIGADMGIVMGKGVLLSMICILTILPSLIIFSDRLIEKTAKKAFSLKMDCLGRFSFRYRKIILCVFAVFFALMFFLKGNTGIAFSLSMSNDVSPVFPMENQIIVLYDNRDEEAIGKMIPGLEGEDFVVSVYAWPNTLGKAFTSEELAGFLSSMDMGFELSPTLLDIVYSAYFGAGGNGTLTLPELITFVSENFAANPLIGRLINDDMRTALENAPAMLSEYESQLKGPAHSIMAITTTLPVESDRTSAFISHLDQLCREELSGEYYLIGNSPMACEMVDSFSGELNFLTLLTAAAIFIVVMITFRSLCIPAVLILLIQSAVYATMVMMNLQGLTIYYLALLVVQGILMGATIDYAIVFTNYYRTKRRTMDRKDSLIAAYNESIHTILTSGTIMVAVTGAVGFAYDDPTIQQIVHSISKGAACAIVLILFLLPGVLAALDRWVISRKER